MCTQVAMQSDGKHARLPRAFPISKAQTFTCGIFGVCSPFLSSPRTPPCRVPNNSEDLSASDILLIQDGSTDENSETFSVRSRTAETPTFYSLNIIPSTGADSTVPLSPLQSKSARRREFTENELTRFSPVQVLSDQQHIELLLTKIRKGFSSKSSLETLLKLVSESESGNIRALEEKVASVLITLLTSRKSDECFKHTEPYEESFAAVCRLVHNEAILKLSTEPDMLTVLDWVLNKGSLDTRANAVILLQKIASHESLEKTVVGRQSLLEGIVTFMLKREQPNATKLGVRTLLSFCLCEENRCGAVKAGAVPAITKILPSASVPTAEKGLAVLELLATTPEGRTAMSEHQHLVSLLVSTILKVSDRATEYAAGSLCAICTPDTLEIQQRTVQAGAQTRLLLLLQSHCTQRAKRKALQLLKVLHKFWEQEPRNAGSGQTERIHF